MVVPAHIYTLVFFIWLNVGFDGIEDCFLRSRRQRYLQKTGLSNDPEMSWRLSKLDKYSLISNSDSHSPYGQEANVLIAN